MSDHRFKGKVKKLTISGEPQEYTATFFYKDKFVSDDNTEYGIAEKIEDGKNSGIIPLPADQEFKIKNGAVFSFISLHSKENLTIMFNVSEDKKIYTIDGAELNYE